MTNPPFHHGPPVATNASHVNQQACTASSNLSAPLVANNLVMQEYDLVSCATFPTLMAPAKFSLIVAMKNLFQMMLKD